MRARTDCSTRPGHALTLAPGSRLRSAKAVRLGLIVPGGFDLGERVIPALQNLAAELARRHEVHVFAAAGPSGRGCYEHEGVTVHQLSKNAEATVHGLGRSLLGRGRLIGSMLREMRRASPKGAFDLLHAFWADDTGFVMTVLGRTLRVPAVVSIGGGEAVWIPEARYGGAGSVAGRVRLRATLRVASAVTAGSAFAADFLPGEASRRARIIPLGVRWETFEAPPDRPEGPPWRLVHVGDLNFVKDQETLLRAFARVLARCADSSLDCIGEDTQAGRLRETARALGIERHVTFHGFLPQRRLPEFFRRAHLNVLSSRYESQGVAVLEAAAAGLPTVGTAVGLLPTLAPAAARCVAVGDSGALGDAITALLVDAAARRSIGAAAQRWAIDHDAAWTARQFEDLYASVLR
jgi:glycosyltransferase involved in cell wall biosynthesis